MPFAKPVSEYMSYPVHSVEPDARVADVRNRLDEMGISCLAVINESGALLGVISPADLVRVGQPSADGEGKILVLPDREDAIPRR